MMIQRLFFGCAVIGLCSGCATMNQQTRTELATQTGAIVGGTVGAVVGDQIGGYNGSFWGSMLGSVAGVAVGAIAASSYNKQHEKNLPPVSIYRNPVLVVNDIILQDDNGNKTIDAGERCLITFVITNKGNEKAVYVQPVIKPKGGNAKKIRLSSPVTIVSIEPGEEIDYTVQTRASDNLKSGQAEFEFYLEEGNGFGTSEELFSIPTYGVR